MQLMLVSLSNVHNWQAGKIKETLGCEKSVDLILKNTMG